MLCDVIELPHTVRVHRTCLSISKWSQKLIHVKIKIIVPELLSIDRDKKNKIYFFFLNDGIVIAPQCQM